MLRCFRSRALVRLQLVGSLPDANRVQDQISPALHSSCRAAYQTEDKQQHYRPDERDENGRGRKKCSISRRGLSRRAATNPPSDSRRECFRDFSVLPCFGLFERLQCARSIEMIHGVKLAAQIRPKIMTESLRLRTVDHTDGALQSRLRQQRRLGRRTVQVEKEPLGSCLVKSQLVAVWKCGPHGLELTGIVPVRRRDHGACVGGEAEEYRR